MPSRDRVRQPEAISTASSGTPSGPTRYSLSDRLLTDLVEHFSQYTLSNSLVAPDMLGQAYEYLIKHFADLTNKKAGEF